MAIYTRQGSFPNGVPADGGQVRSELDQLALATNSIVSAQITDGTIVNADINASAAIAVSKTTLGTFTDWTTWTPTLTGNGLMTLSGITINLAKYTQIGNLVSIVLDADFTVGGTPNKAIVVAGLPVAVTNQLGGGGAGIYDNALRMAASWEWSGVTTIQVYKGDYTNYTAGAASLNLNFIYGAAL